MSRSCSGNVTRRHIEHLINVFSRNEGRECEAGRVSEDERKWISFSRNASGRADVIDKNFDGNFRNNVISEPIDNPE